MKIGDTARTTTVRSVAATRRTAKAYGAAAVTAPRAVADTTSIMGIPENELTPKVRAAITTLLGEVDRMRQEVADQNARIGYLEQLADQDTLTPVINRRAFVRELSRMVSYGERYGGPSSVIYIDLNGLKEINDTFGHAVGDAALTKVATMLTEQVRGSDIVGRLGGDEFGVLLSRADEAAAVEKAAQLGQVIAENPLSWEREIIPLRVALGIHTFTGGEDAGEALAAADKAMYVQKNAARIASKD